MKASQTRVKITCPKDRVASTRLIKKNSSVSIITITQFVRFDCLIILNEMIKAQTCTNIIEWVIVEGSKNKEDAIKNNELIKTLQATIKIVYLEYTGKKLGELRNIGNKSCVGDIIVCMDDDDYYPPERVQHCVESLEKSGYLLAGCSALYLYEYFMGKL
jgi:glycosyltransferase involved in cell wall biosynthesis